MKSLTVSRLDRYPSDEPMGWAVGFTCECDNGRSFYVDTVVSFDDADTDEEAVNHGLSVLKDDINSRCVTESEKSSLLGTDVMDLLD